MVAVTPPPKESQTLEGLVVRTADQTGVTATRSLGQEKVDCMVGRPSGPNWRRPLTLYHRGRPKIFRLALVCGWPGCRQRLCGLRYRRVGFCSQHLRMARPTA